MSQLIERYVYDVVRRLPENEREEVRRELEANIYDMLPENPSEQEITDVLTKLGAPSILAEQYRRKQMYLISPAMYGMYISVLKPVVIIVAIVMACIGISSEFIHSLNGKLSLEGIFDNMFSMCFEGVFQVIVFVTIGFVIAERSGKFKTPDWTVSSLPRLPDRRGVKIPRSGTIAAMVVSVFFTGLIIAMIINDQWLFVIVKDSIVINPFSKEALLRCIPYILVMELFSLVAAGAKLYWGHWNIALCAVNAVYNVIWVSITISILHWNDLFSPEFISSYEHFFSYTLEPEGFIPFVALVRIISSVLIVIAAIDTGTAVWNTWKGMSKDGYGDNNRLKTS